MLRTLKFPLLYVVEATLWLPLITAFYGVTSFVAAEPIASLDLQGKSLPIDWEAAVPNHGKFLRGYLIANHPVAFVAILVVLLGSAFLLFRVHSAQKSQRKAAEHSMAKAHNIANGCVFVTFAILGYLLVRFSFAVAVQPN